MGEVFCTASVWILSSVCVPVLSDIVPVLARNQESPSSAEFGDAERANLALFASGKTSRSKYESFSEGLKGTVLLS